MSNVSDEHTYKYNEHKVQNRNIFIKWLSELHPRDMIEKHVLKAAKKGGKYVDEKLFLWFIFPSGAGGLKKRDHSILSVNK